MKDMFIRQNLVSGQSVQELLQHALALLHYDCILFALVLNVGIVGYSSRRIKAVVDSQLVSLFEHVQRVQGVHPGEGQKSVDLRRNLQIECFSGMGGTIRVG